MTKKVIYSNVGCQQLVMVDRSNLGISQGMTKPTKWPVCPAKTWSDQSGYSPRLISVFAVFALGTHKAHKEGSDLTRYAQADLSLRWAHRSLCWFCHALAQYLVSNCQSLKCTCFCYQLSVISNGSLMSFALCGISWFCMTRCWSLLSCVKRLSYFDLVDFRNLIKVWFVRYQRYCFKILFMELTVKYCVPIFFWLLELYEVKPFSSL